MVVEGMVIERDAERAAIDELLAAARRGRSGALVMRGPAGIGKSALLEYALEQPGWARVLRADGVEAEQDLPYAGLNLLLRPLQGCLDAVPEAQRAALGSVFGSVSGSVSGAGGVDHPDTRFLLGLAVLSLLATAAEDGPLLCLLDDVQWFDDASTQVLLFAARRLDAEGVVLLFATRDDDPHRYPVRTIDVGPLSEQGAAALLARHRPDLAVVDRLRVLTASAGNPLALLELRPQGADAPLTGRLRSAFEERLRGLSDEARFLLLVAAAEGTGDLGVVLRASGAALTVLDSAERLGLITLTGAEIAFRHPLLRAAAYHSAPPSARIAAHTALAAALTAPADRDRRAWHRAKAVTGLDDEVAAELEDTAERARQRGGYEAAAAAYSQAARLSSIPSDQARRFVLAGETAAETARLDQARAAAEQAARLPGDPGLRARIARVHATADFKQGRPRSAHAVLTEGASQIAGSDPHQELRMHLTAANAAWTVGDAGLLAVTHDRLSAVDLPDHDPMASVHRFLIWMTAVAAGRPTGDLPPPDRTVAEARRAAVRCPYDLSFIAVGGLVAGQERPTRDVVAAMAEESRLNGRVGWLVAMLCLRSGCEVLLGDHQAARSAAEEARDLARDAGLGGWLRRAAGTLAYLAAVEGDEAGCLEAAGEALGGPITGHTVPGSTWAHWALAVQDLAGGRAEAAARRLDVRAGDAGEAGAFDTPAVRGMPDVVEALVRINRHDQAAPVLGRLEHWAAQIRQPAFDALVSRCKALLSDEPEPLYLEALAFHRTDSRPFEHARTALLYGEWLRRVRRKADARGHLAASLAWFESLGARPWADRAAAELEATDPRRTPDSAAAGGLTAQESKIVGLAAEGLSNKEIAARLFLSPRTVGYHLSKAYPKLGVLSRKELVRRRTA